MQRSLLRSRNQCSDASGRGRPTCCVGDGLRLIAPSAEKHLYSMSGVSREVGAF